MKMLICHDIIGGINQRTAGGITCLEGRLTQRDFRHAVSLLPDAIGKEPDFAGKTKQKKPAEESMGKKDLGEKRLEDYADVFADIVNVLAFHGERLLKEEDIVPGPTESIYTDETGTLRSQYRDVLKYDRKGETVISVIGLENQSRVDRDMVLRVMKYNAASYQSQIDQGEAFRRPVFTLVLYFGNKRWSGPKTVTEALKLDDISYGKYAGELVMDGRLNVYEIAFLPKEIRDRKSVV